MNKKLRKLGLGLCLIIAAGLLLPERAVIPVAGAGRGDWHPRTFWYEPWGASGVHKGIDIFAPKGTPLLAATSGFVLYRGELARGGRVILVLGPKWRLHYYAHLETSAVTPGQYVSAGGRIGAVGDTGNARGKPPHLHYSVLTLLPYPWRWDASTQGWKKMFFLNPGELLIRD